MQAQKLYDELMRKQLNRGVKQGVKRGVKQGIEMGLTSLRAAIEQVCTTRGLKLTSNQRAKLAAETDMDVLLRWHAKAITATRAKEIFA